MKKLISSVAVVACLFTVNVFAQEVAKAEKKDKKAKTEKSCSKEEKKACSTEKKACCAKKEEKKA